MKVCSISRRLRAPAFLWVSCWFWPSRPRTPSWDSPETPAWATSFQAISSYLIRTSWYTWSWNRTSSQAIDPKLAFCYLDLEVVQRLDDVIPHRCVFLLQHQGVVLYDRPVGLPHFLVYLVFQLLEGEGLVVQVRGELVGLQIDSELIDIWLYFFVVLAHQSKQFAVFLDLDKGLNIFGLLRDILDHLSPLNPHFL